MSRVWVIPKNGGQLSPTLCDDAGRPALRIAADLALRGGAWDRRPNRAILGVLLLASPAGPASDRAGPPGIWRFVYHFKVRPATSCGGPPRWSSPPPPFIPNKKRPRPRIAKAPRW